MKSVLIIIPYQEIYPPMNGGMQRCFHLLHQLAMHFKVTAIINQDKNSFNAAVAKYPALANITVLSTGDEAVPKDMAFFLPARIKNALRYRWYKRKLRATTDSNFLLYYALLKQELKKNRHDIIVLENLDTINAVDVIRRYNKKIPIIYDTHNVGYRLAEQEVAKGTMKPWQLDSIKSVESKFSQTVDAVLTCSEMELEDLKAINHHNLKGIVIPNGVQLYDILFDEGVKKNPVKNIIFCGSLNYEPNIEGLSWFYNQIWPKVISSFPDLKMLVVGNGELPRFLVDMKNDPSIVVTGKVADVKPFYNKAAVAVVPLKSGSGTRLKILEAMGLGVPVLSTTKGAEGINYIKSTNVIIADAPDEFIEALDELLSNVEERIKLQKNAYELVKLEYDWNTIGNKLATTIFTLLRKNNLEN